MRKARPRGSPDHLEAATQCGPTTSSLRFPKRLQEVAGSSDEMRTTEITKTDSSGQHHRAHEPGCRGRQDCRMQWSVAASAGSRHDTSGVGRLIVDGRRFHARLAVSSRPPG